VDAPMSTKIWERLSDNQ